MKKILSKVLQNCALPMNEKERLKQCIMHFADPESFGNIILSTKHSLEQHFGKRSKVMLEIYDNNTHDPKQWEVLFVIKSPYRPPMFIDKLNEMSLPQLRQYPIDVCRYRKHNDYMTHREDK